MNILAVDTSGRDCGAAVRREGVTVSERLFTGRRQHSVEIMPLIDAVLTESGLTCAEIDIYACVVGPGSFTGVRIGVSTVRGLAHATGKPCLGIDALEAMAAGYPGEKGLLCPMIDARSGQVYAAAFAPGLPPERRLPDTAGPLGKFLSSVVDLSRAFFFVGDGAIAYRETIVETLGERASFTAEDAPFIRPGVVAELAQAYGLERAGGYEDLAPHYLRAPQAERERLAREGEKA